MEWDSALTNAESMKLSNVQISMVHACTRFQFAHVNLPMATSQANVIIYIVLAGVSITLFVAIDACDSCTERGFAELLKNLTRYRAKNNFVGSSK